MLSSSFRKITFLSAIAALNSTPVEAQTPKALDQSFFSEFGEAFADSGLNWEPYEAVTEDGWTLTVFRVFKVIDESLSPLVIQGGGNMMPLSWAGSWVEDVANNGYDCWLTSWRGMLNSDTNVKDGTWSGKEKWNFSWAEGGMIDIPAQLEVALKVTGKSKVTYMAYSQGTTASMYGLTKRQDWYAERVDRAVIMASCIVNTSRNTYEDAVKEFAEWEKSGFYLYTMGNFGQTLAGTQASATSKPLNTALHFKQISLAGQFQEFIPFRDWALGTQKSTAVDFADFDKIPVTFLHGKADNICFVEQAQEAFDAIGISDKNIYIDETFGHSEYKEKMDPVEMMNVIETGTREAALRFGLIGLLAVTSALY